MRFTKLHWPAAISAALWVSGLLAPQVCATKHPKHGGTLRVELSAASVSLDPRTWKPGSVAAAQSAKLAFLIYDRLVTLDEFGRFQPALATEWTHDASFRNWQFKLRAGIHVSDGSVLAPKEVGTALQPLLPAGLQIVASENGVQIRASHSCPDLLEQLASGRYFVSIVRPDNSLVGTGPFVLAESVAATPSEMNPSAIKPAHLKFRANEEAWEGRPFLDEIDVTLGNPPQRQVLNLQVGRADIVDISPDLVRKARQENLRVWSSPPHTLLALRFDEAQLGSADRRLREALDLALDRDTMANVLLQRQGLPASALLPQWLSGYAFLFSTPMNLEHAKELRATLPAASAGANEPLHLRIDTVGDLMKLLGERVAVNARQANITIQVAVHSASSATASPSTVGLHLFAWQYDSLSPRAELQALAEHLHMKTAAESPESLDPEKLFAQERRLLADRQILPLMLLPEYVGIAPSVRNWSAAPSGEWRLADIWIDACESVLVGPDDAATERNVARGVHP